MVLKSELQLCPLGSPPKVPHFRSPPLGCLVPPTADQTWKGLLVSKQTAYDLLFDFCVCALNLFKYEKALQSLTTSVHYCVVSVTEVKHLSFSGNKDAFLSHTLSDVNTYVE